VKTGLKIDFKVLTHVRTDLETLKPEIFNKRKEPDGFSHENPNRVHRVRTSCSSHMRLLLWLLWFFF
jgi:hypothetical protein